MPLRDTIVFALVTVAFVVTSGFVMFSTFMVYDDEGYVLLSLRNFAEHGGLYREVYTQYGPFPFVFYQALQVLGLPLTHMTGRFITIGAWTGVALSCAALASFVTRSLMIRLSVLVSAFVYLWVMASEPTHPGGLIVFITALLAALGYRWILRGESTHWALAVGAGIAALTLTKINVGVFAAFSAGSWLLLHHRNDAIRRWAPVILAACTIALPLGLMRPLLGTPWVRTFALVFACSGIATVIAVATHSTSRAGWLTLAAFAGAALATCLLVIGVVLLRDTTLLDLLNGVLLAPLRHPVSFSLRYLWPPGIGPIAVISVVACIAACLLRRRHRPSIELAVAALRLLATAALIINVARYPTISPDYLTLGCALPLVWLFVWPLGDEAAAKTSARAWLALLFLGQSLHAFPVPGSQIAWGTVLAIPLAGVGAWDAVSWLARDRARWLGAKTPVLIAHTALLVFIGAVGWKFATVGTRYRDGKYLALPGAEIVRLPNDSAARYQVLAMNAVAHADLLFSLPGMFSFNLWTGLPTPTQSNVTHWFSLLDESRQRAIIRALETHARACVIVDRAHVKFLATRGLEPRGPLHTYLQENFEPAFILDDFEFHVHRGRRIHPFLLAESLTRGPDKDIRDTHRSRLLRFALPLPPSTAIAAVEITSGDASLVLDGSNAHIEVAPINLRGEIIGAAQLQSWPVRLQRASVVLVYYDAANGPRPDATLVLRDATQRQIGLARMR